MYIFLRQNRDCDFKIHFLVVFLDHSEINKNKGSVVQRPLVMLYKKVCAGAYFFRSLAFTFNYVSLKCISLFFIEPSIVHFMGGRII